MKKRLLTFVLSLALALTMVPMLPAVAYASDDSIKITGLAPAEGATPVTDPSKLTVSDGYKVTGIVWYYYDDEGLEATPTTFKAFRNYYASITVERTTGPKIEESTSIEIDGVTYYTDEEGDGSCDIDTDGETAEYKVSFPTLQSKTFKLYLTDEGGNSLQGMTNFCVNDKTSIYVVKASQKSGKVTYKFYNSDKDGTKGSYIYESTTGKFSASKLGFNYGKRWFLVKATDEGGHSASLKMRVECMYNIADAKITVKNRVYNGKSGRTPDITVKAKLNGEWKTLKKGTDYTIFYTGLSEDRKSVGTYKFSLDGNVNKSFWYYEDSDMDIFRTFKVIPKGTSIDTIKAGSKKLTVKWNKQSAKMSKSRITGYQVQVATNKSFTKNKKSYKVKGYDKVSKTFKNLKGGKKYYVRVRTYKVVKGNTYYSKWSDVKTKTTKK